MAETHGSYNSDRLDRIERILETVVATRAGMRQDMKNLDRSQVVTRETLHKLTLSLDKALKEMAAAQKRADESMAALLLTVDEFIRRRKPQ